MADAAPGQERDASGRGLDLVVHASLTARRLGLAAPPRSPGLFDALELFAFVRPAQFCAPSAAGLARALGLAEAESGCEALALSMQAAAAKLLAELAAAPVPAGPSGAGAQAQAMAPRRLGLGPAGASARCESRAPADMRPNRCSGLDAWARLPEWEDEGAAGPADQPAARPRGRRRPAAGAAQHRRPRRGRPTQADLCARGGLRLPAARDARASPG